MARFYSDENIAFPVVAELRRLGHDVLTSFEAGRANHSVPDAEVLAFATEQNRILLSHNRRHFLQLHRDLSGNHAGLALCTYDPDFVALAERLHAAVEEIGDIRGRVVRINRPD